ncbi:hypothetical protein JL720_11520 [Aureococcus anophagefferens]|nr:hypothetical protein JL720_11520 [Aureococcus anophagefferens]
MLAAAPVRLWLFDKSAVPTRCYGELAVAGAPHYVVVDAPLFFADVISCIDKNFSSLAAEAYRPGNGTGVFSSHCDYVKVVLNGSGYSYGGASAAGLRVFDAAFGPLAANLKKKNLTIPQCTLGINGDGRQFQFHVDDITSAARCVFACGPGAKALAQRLSRFHGGVVRTILVDEGAVLIMPSYVMTKNPGNVDGHFAQADDGDVAASDYIMHSKLPDEFVASLLGVDGPCSNTGVFDVADASGAKAYDQVAGEIACSLLEVEAELAAAPRFDARGAPSAEALPSPAAPEARRFEDWLALMPSAKDMEAKIAAKLADRAAEKAERDAERAAKLAAKLADRAAEKAARDAEWAAKLADRAAEKAARRTGPPSSRSSGGVRTSTGGFVGDGAAMNPNAQDFCPRATTTPRTTPAVPIDGVSRSTWRQRRQSERDSERNGEAAGEAGEAFRRSESIMGTPQLVTNREDLVAALRAAGGDAFRVKVHVTGCDCHRAAAFGEVAPGLLAIPDSRGTRTALHVAGGGGREALEATLAASLFPDPPIDDVVLKANCARCVLDLEPNGTVAVAPSRQSAAAARQLGLQLEPYGLPAKAAPPKADHHLLTFLNCPQVADTDVFDASHWILELPGGKRNLGETAWAAARRETSEEALLWLDDAEPAVSYDLSTMRCFVVAATAPLRQPPDALARIASALEVAGLADDPPPPPGPPPPPPRPPPAAPPPPRPPG